MKKIGLLLSAIGLLVSSCGDKNAYTITGTMPASVADNSVVYLQGLASDWKSRTNLDSAVVLNGEFRFVGMATDVPVLGFVALAGENEALAPFAHVILEPGEIEIAYDVNPVVKGTASNDSYQAFVARGISFNERGRISMNNLQALSEEMKATTDEAKKNELEAKAEAIYESNADDFFAYLKANIKTEAAAFFLVNNSYFFDFSQLSELVPNLKSSSDRVDALKKRVDALAATQPGKTFTDLKGKTPEDADIALSDYAGKDNIVLVDFWASWCPPCRKDMPAVVELYKKYKELGFEIVGVSIDDEVEKWQLGIEELNVTWPQISDLKGWESELSGAYGVASIPHTVLIGKDGKIIARGLNVEELDTKIGELLQ